MIKCPTCNGTGEQTIIVREVNFKTPAPETKTKITCIMCNGVGQLTKEQEDTYLAMREFNRTAWCKCGNPSGNTTYHDDGEGPEINKHHWRCDDCGKITQIG